MVLPLGHQQGLRKASGLAAATRPDCYPVLNQAEEKRGSHRVSIYLMATYNITLALEDATFCPGGPWVSPAKPVEHGERDARSLFQAESGGKTGKLSSAE
jgi:hypothetical protein